MDVEGRVAKTLSEQPCERERWLANVLLSGNSLDYHLLALEDIDLAKSKIVESKDFGAIEQRGLAETERYNEEIGATEARARAHAAFLEDDLVPANLRDEIGKTLWELSIATTDVPSVKRRIELFKLKTPAVMNLLTQIHKIISDEIGSPLS